MVVGPPAVFAFVSCPSGQVALGGGGLPSGTGAHNPLTTSIPTTNGGGSNTGDLANGWFATAGIGGGNYQAYVICAPTT
ncbi:hypothetical protein ACFYXS_35810 [Streptomyces sp. NPDC002574]|uniref:hypothetical protein n=1 Tax=Streptomyces sp. NPDC002574 TaxID=3364652 RepID=UPI0036A6F165